MLCGVCSKCERREKASRKTRLEIKPLALPRAASSDAHATARLQCSVQGALLGAHGVQGVCEAGRLRVAQRHGRDEAFQRGRTD